MEHHFEPIIEADDSKCSSSSESSIQHHPAPTPYIRDLIGQAKSESQSSLYSIESTASASKISIRSEDEESAAALALGLRKYLGFFLTLLSGLLYSLAALLVKLLKDKYHPFMISIWRFQGVLIPSILLVTVRLWCMKRSDFQSVWPLTEKRKAKTFIILMVLCSSV
jgi:hypothetical protein